MTNPFTSLLGQSSPANQNGGEDSQSPYDFGEIDLSTELPTMTLEQLADYDTDGVRMLRDKADALLAKSDAVVLQNTDELRAVLDALDAAMERDPRLDLFSLGAVRSYIKTTMITLNKMPEFESILLDKDIHNVIRFARDTFSAAHLEATVKADRAERGQKKNAPVKAKKVADIEKMMKAFGDLKLGGLPELDL